jgi:hypothetical protein
MRPPRHTAIATALRPMSRNDGARRHMKASAIAVAFVLSATVACQALSILNTIDDWTCSPETERFALARTLALVAGQGRPELGAEFFLNCMEDAATGDSPLSLTQINEIAAGCVLFSSTVFTESG